TECAVYPRDPNGHSRIELRCSASIDLMDFARSIFADRGFVEGTQTPGGWRTLVLRDVSAAPIVAIRGRTLVGIDGQNWEGIVANLAIACVMHEQDNSMFFHVGSVSISGNGMMLCGPKGSGKTSIALALAMRGHVLLSEEIAALRIGTRQLLPLRRALSI